MMAPLHSRRAGSMFGGRGKLQEVVLLIFFLKNEEHGSSSCHILTFHDVKRSVCSDLLENCNLPQYAPPRERDGG